MNLTDAHNLENHQEPVAVLGCGLMGSAVARQLALAGHRVVVWNRTAERARALAGDGITAVDSVDEAFRHASLVVTCMLSYAATTAALETVTTTARPTIVSLSAGRPDEARNLEEWAADRGSAYLDGLPVAFPRDIGTPSGMLIYSGRLSTWRHHESTLACLGGSSWLVAEEVTAAKVLTVGLSSFFVTAQRAHLEALDYLHGRVPMDSVRRVSDHLVDLLGDVTREAIEAVDAPNPEPDQATIATLADLVRTNLEVLRASDHNAPIFEATARDVENDMAAGRGNLAMHARASN